MASVAERAGSSKETLYAWFGNKQGLFTALIQRQAEAANQAVAAALDHRGDADATQGSSPAETLTRFAANLLLLLLGERSVAINRAAMAELGGGTARGTGELAAVLLAQGRHRTGPMAEAYLARWPTKASWTSPTRPRPSSSCTGWWSRTSRSGACSASPRRAEPRSTPTPGPPSTASSA
jgi:AcrR family transcriptional regulator